MKNKSVFILSFFILLFAVFGCSSYNPLSSGSDTNTNSRQNSKSDNKTLADKTIDSTIGEEKIGVPECDELMNKLAEQSKSSEDDYVTKATKQFFLNRIREGVRKSIEENKSDKTQLAKNCVDYQNQFDKFLKEENKENLK